MESTNTSIFSILKADHISDFHANTHIPIVIGAQMRYEVTGDELYQVRGHVIDLGLIY